mmetsp:Transcript_7188/g.21185  ORF Transcript_7188/g.21185 Transcript_7188/m.21185 type:complete len:156 (+) Transcript_7188:194-661(+)
MRAFIALCALAATNALRAAPCAATSPRAPRARLHAAPVGDDEFANPVPVMKEVMDNVPGFEEGRTVTFGVLSREVTDAPSQQEQAARRAAAARDLTNIGEEERNRRGAAGAVLGVATIAYALSLVLNHASALDRLTVFPLLFLAVGFTDSARTGM